jgi:hypothetical protein
MMIDPNVAYTDEYKRYREEYSPVFTRGEIYETELPDGRHITRITEYTDNENIVRPYRTVASRLEILNRTGLKVAEFDSIYHKEFYSFIEHKNGRNYLVFSIDLYGYSVIDLSDYRHIHYVPESSFSKGQETFIWTNVLYNRRNNLIAVDGCFWAGPWQTDFFDFSRPMELPFEKLCSTNDMEDQFDVGYDVIPIEWNDDGTITLENETEQGIVRKNIDVLDYRASP